MDIREVIKLEQGARVKRIDSIDSEVWVVQHDDSLRMEGHDSLWIEDVYPLCCILDLEFERCDEQLTIQEVLCRERLGHRIKMIGDNINRYRVAMDDYGLRVDLAVDGDIIHPMYINAMHNISTIMDSLYIDLDECGRI